MYSDNAPPSFTPGEISGYDLDQFQPTSTVQIHPPSQGDMTHNQGNSLNQFQGPTATTYRGLGQPTVTADNTKPPSFTDLKQGQVNSYNHDPNISRGAGGTGKSYSGYSASGQAPSLGAMAKVNVSQTDSRADNNSYNKDGKSPGHSDVDRRGSSDTGAAETKPDAPDANELVGISLVGKNFRKFYPNAYFREEDEE